MYIVVKNSSCIFLIIFLIFVLSINGDTQEGVEIKETQKSLKEVYRELKKLKEGQVFIYYKKETIIREPEDKRGYLKHLLTELEKALKKGKKCGKVRRAEGNLVEIDKGAIHKVHERDVYIVYDSSGRYKGKVEIGAIADAISIGRSYEIKKDKRIEPGDKVKYRGNRKFFEWGIVGGEKRSMKLAGGGFTWKWNFRGGWGIELWTAGFRARRSVINEKKDVREDAWFLFPIGVKKYFFGYPGWISGYIGSGIYYFEGDYDQYYPEDEEVRKFYLYPWLSMGIEFFSGYRIHMNFEIRYLYGPTIHIGGEKFVARPLFMCIGFSTGW
ncbi:MAG: hypothetical protein DRI36_02955 [Caldiserica bacterium]|nr:MAG: hypothetical protein DRI36_02955 [Caldisericota bacterium]